MADAANISKENKFNLLGIFDQINSPQVPFRIPQMSLALVLKATPEELKLRHVIKIFLTDPDNTELNSFPELPFHFPLEAPTGKLNLVLAINNMEFLKFGDYTFKIAVDGEYLGEAVIQIIPVAENALQELKSM